MTTRPREIVVDQLGQVQESRRPAGATQTLHRHPACHRDALLEVQGRGGRKETGPEAMTVPVTQQLEASRSWLHGLYR